MILHTVNTIFQTSPITSWAAALDGSQALVKLLRPIPFEETPSLITSKCTSGF
jgi:hypothetical protein